MAYAKLSLLPLFLLATFLLMFAMKNVEGCGTACSIPFSPSLVCSGGCFCFKLNPGGVCLQNALFPKMVKEHPDLCESHVDCTRKGSGSFCALFPDSDLKYGWCYDSNSHAQASFKNAIGSEFSKFLKMPSALST